MIIRRPRSVVIFIAVVGLLVAFCLSYPWLKQQLEIDRCLDRGGRWNYETKACEYVEAGALDPM